MDFEHEIAPVAQRVGLVEDEIGAAADGAPFLQEDGPGGYLHVTWNLPPISIDTVILSFYSVD